MQDFSEISLPKSHSRIIVRVVDICIRRRWWVVAAAMVLLVVSSAYTVTHFAINTDTGRLIASDVPWRQREAALDAAFPERVDMIAIVIDGDTAEAAEQASAALAERLQKLPVIRSVRRPDGGPFFAKNALLFLSPAEV